VHYLKCENRVLAYCNLTKARELGIAPFQMERVQRLRRVRRSMALTHRLVIIVWLLTDAHLKTLQTLSAHLKLLLDSPEHLWRWLEKKQFLHAAWLFLLARTVYRKLSRSADEEESEDEENEGGDINWSRHGIDVMVGVQSNYHFQHCSSRLIGTIPYCVKTMGSDWSVSPSNCP
jgi:hypothetical protein